MMRPTKRTFEILELFNGSTSTTVCGYDVIRNIKMGRGGPYHLLKRLENAGWLTSIYNPTSNDTNRPKRLYSLTQAGLSAINTAHLYGARAIGSSDDLLVVV